MPVQKRIDWIWLAMASVICSAPWLLGSVQPSVYRWQLLILAAISVAIFASWVRTSNRPTMSSAGIIVLGILLAAAALGAFQQFELPTALLENATPKACEYWRQAVPQDGPVRETISLYPWSTRQQVAALAIPAAVFCVMALLPLGRHSALICGVIAANGALFALFGIAQRLAYNGKIYWMIPLSQGGHPFAAFVNQNNAGGYLNMCLAAAVGWFLCCLEKTTSVEHDWGDDDWGRPTPRKWTAEMFWASAAIVTIFAGILFTFSRGAILSLAVSGAALFLALATLYGLRNVTKVGVGIAIVGLGLFVWLGQSHRLVDRWDETMDELQTRNVSRLSHWQDALRVAKDFPLTGTGLGTYRFAYRPYETRAYRGLYFHAENQYVESIVEAGWGGLLLLMAALMTVVVASFHAVRGSSQAQRSIGIVAGMAMVSQAVHAGFDFGLYLPANAILLAAIAGMVCQREPLPGQGGRVGGFWAMVVAVWAGWGFFVVNAGHQAQALVTASRVWNGQQALELSVLDRHANQLQRALAGTRGFAEGHFELARLHGLRYQTAATEALVKEVGNTEAAAALRQLASPMAWHRRCYELQMSGETEALEMLQNSKPAADFINAAAEQLKIASTCCPMLNRTFISLAQWSVIESPPWSDGRYVQRGIALAPKDPDVLFRGGLVHVQAGRTDQGVAAWKDSLALSPKYTSQILQMSSGFLSPDQLSESILPDDPERLVQIGHEIDGSQTSKALRDRLADHLQRRMDADDQEWLPGLRSYLEASVAKLRGDSAAAVGLMESAVEAAPDNVDWRRELARDYLELGNLQRAAHHARELVAQRPSHRGYRQLLRRINRRLAN